MQLMVVGLELGALKRLFGIFLCSERFEQFSVVVSVLYCPAVLPFLVIPRSSSIFVLGQYIYACIFQIESILIVEL